MGYPRTGTTFLQKNIFPQHREINYVVPKDYLQSQTALTLQKLDRLGNIFTSKEIDEECDLKEIENIINIEHFINIKLMCSQVRDIQCLPTSTILMILN